MIKNKNLKMISNRLDELITSDFISFNKDNMFKDVELCIDVPKMYYEINTSSLDGFYINNMLSDDNYLPKYESLLHVDKFILENNPQVDNSRKEYKKIGSMFIKIFSYLILKFINKYVSARNALHLAHVFIYNLDIIILRNIELRKDYSYKNSDKFYIKGGDVYIPAIEKSNGFQIDFSKGINCYIYDRMKLTKLCGYLLGVEKYEEKIYLPLFKRIIKNAFGTMHNLMLLEEDYLTICDYCGEFFIKHKNDLIGHTYTVNNITKHICPDCYDYKNKYEVS
jgi:hypothetical protein